MIEEWLLSVEERRKIWDNATRQKVGDWEDELLRAQILKIAEWGDELACPHFTSKRRKRLARRECYACWNELRKEADL